MLICYHHNDMDGKSAGYMVHKYKPATIQDSASGYFSTSYDDKFNKHTEKDDVFIVDLSFTEATYASLVEICNTARTVTWIDHHASSEQVVKDHFDELQHISNLTYFVSTCACGSALTYAYLTAIDMNEFKTIRQIGDGEEYHIDASYNEGTITITTRKHNSKNPTDQVWYEYKCILPQWLYMVDDYDCWKQQCRDTERFILGVDAVNTSVVDFNRRVGIKVFNSFWANMTSDAGSVAKYIADGTAIQKYLHSRYNRELRHTFEWTYNGTTFCCKNGTGNSWNFEELIKRYPAVILFHYSGASKKWTYSVYADESSDFDCKGFCEQFGGGGHPRAAGFSTEQLIFVNPIDLDKEITNKIFLGGTTNEIDWRSEFISYWKKSTDPITDQYDLFNPIVDNWDEEAQKKENDVKKHAAVNLFVITPDMTGQFSCAEAVECSHYGKVFFAIYEKQPGSLDKRLEGSLNAVGEVVKKHNGRFETYKGEGSMSLLVKDLIQYAKK